MILRDLINQLLDVDLTSSITNGNVALDDDRLIGRIQDVLVSGNVRKFYRLENGAAVAPVDTYTSSGHYLNVSIGDTDIRYEMLKDELPDVLPSTIYAYSFEISKTEYIVFSIEAKMYVGVGYKE